MTVVAAVLAALVVVTGMISMLLVGTRKRVEFLLREWPAAAEALGLRASVSEDKRSMQGTLQGVPVRVEFSRETLPQNDSHYSRNETTFTRSKIIFSAGGDGRIPKSIELRGEDSWAVLARLGAGPDRETGDRGFDELVDLRGLDAYVCAALSEQAREQLKTFAPYGGSVSNGRVTWAVMDTEDHDRRWLIEHIERVAALAAELSVTPDVLAQRLAHNAQHDSNPRVRRQNLRFLLAPEALAPVELTTAITRALLTDPDPEVRFDAARQLGSEGHATLQGLATDARAEPALRSQALMALHEGNAVNLDLWLASLLNPSPLELTRAALVIVASRRLSAHVDRVIDLTGAGAPALRAAAALTLSQLESSRIETTLWQLLVDVEEDVQTAAAEALGEVGSVAAVEPLLLLSKGLGRARLRQAARGAIARIQSRLADVEAGRLSLVADDNLAGAVALADAGIASGGEVTIAPDAEEPALSRRS